MRPKDPADAAVTARDAIARAMSMGMGLALGEREGARPARDAAHESPAAIRAMAALALRTDHTGALMDALARRLASARATVHLYEALLARLDGGQRLPAGATRARIQRLTREERAQAELAHSALHSLGGDPSLVTIGAEVEAVLSLGLHEVLGTGRVDLAQHLRALTMAELAGEDGWMVLTTLACLLEREDLARRFERAWLRDKRHARTVRRWSARLRRERARPAARAEVEQSHGA